MHLNSRKAVSYGNSTNKIGNESLIDLSDEQVATIKQAEANLTPKQREQISRQVSIQMPRQKYFGEGTLAGKGKSIDPRNWGTLDLNDDEVNPETQFKIEDVPSEPNLRPTPQATTEAMSKTMIDHIVNLTSNSGRHSTLTTPAQSATDRPSDFIAQDSQFGKAMFNMHMDSQPRHVTEPWGPSTLGVEG
ncbi:hypothetical protein GYMLUDRAFT_60684 [Collybiopsis luxurians FD-317 M1]|uniref:Uncharacterized protein n=1 Tax=Collybiopsis luxurians FD-317 M1 TaxID=944289 RepID=A0A0D0CSK8_9AGAR|nr:hypothetical protein GYMLUDRAFT_60684 [Collybiopsis luxurians FD-317 M1]